MNMLRAFTFSMYLVLIFYFDINMARTLLLLARKQQNISLISHEHGVNLTLTFEFWQEFSKNI